MVQKVSSSPLELLQMTKEGERNCASYLYLGLLGSIFSVKIEFIRKADFGILSFFYKYLNNGVGIFATHSTGLKTS